MLVLIHLHPHNSQLLNAVALTAEQMQLSKQARRKAG